MCTQSLKRFGIFPFVVLVFEAFETFVGEKIIVLQEPIESTTIRATKEVTRRSLHFLPMEFFSRTHGITQRAVKVAEVTEASLPLALSTSAVLRVCYKLKYKTRNSTALSSANIKSSPTSSPLYFTSEEPIRHVGERCERVRRHRQVSTKQDDNFATRYTCPHCVYEALLFRTCGAPI